MSATTAHRMNTVPAFAPIARLRDLVANWRLRAWERQGLLLLEDRDLRDLGISRGQAAYEASKPFWRV